MKIHDRTLYRYGEKEDPKFAIKTGERRPPLSGELYLFGESEVFKSKHNFTSERFSILREVNIAEIITERIKERIDHRKLTKKQVMAIVQESIKFGLKLR